MSDILRNCGLPLMPIDDRIWTNTSIWMEGTPPFRDFEAEVCFDGGFETFAHRRRAQELIDKGFITRSELAEIGLGHTVDGRVWYGYRYRYDEETIIPDELVSKWRPTPTVYEGSMLETPVAYAEDPRQSADTIGWPWNWFNDILMPIPSRDDDSNLYGHAHPTLYPYIGRCPREDVDSWRYEADDFEDPQIGYRLHVHCAVADALLKTLPLEDRRIIVARYMVKDPVWSVLERSKSQLKLNQYMCCSPFGGVYRLGDVLERINEGARWSLVHDWSNDDEYCDYPGWRTNYAMLVNRQIIFNIDHGPWCLGRRYDWLGESYPRYMD